MATLSALLMCLMVTAIQLPTAFTFLWYRTNPEFADSLFSFGEKCHMSLCTADTIHNDNCQYHGIARFRSNGSIFCHATYTKAEIGGSLRAVLVTTKYCENQILQKSDSTLEFGSSNMTVDKLLFSDGSNGIVYVQPCDSAKMEFEKAKDCQVPICRLNNTKYLDRLNHKRCFAAASAKRDTNDSLVLEHLEYFVVEERPSGCRNLPNPSWINTSTCYELIFIWEHIKMIDSGSPFVCENMADWRQLTIIGIVGAVNDTLDVNERAYFRSIPFVMGQ